MNPVRNLFGLGICGVVLVGLLACSFADAAVTAPVVKPVAASTAATAASSATVTAATAAIASAQPLTSIAAAVADSRREATNRLRDQYRHPAQTLAFFDVTPESKLAEIYPSGGWYAEILAPLLKAKGAYYAVLPWIDPNNKNARVEGQKRFAAMLAADPVRFDAVRTTSLTPPDHVAITPPGTADHVLTFRNVHNWLADDSADAMFSAFYTALAPGGILGVVEHRARPGTTLEVMKRSGYVTEAEVVALAKKAGFDFVARSDINANPKDTTDHPEGVWTLPPSYALGDKDRAKYQAIGESDRMTLKFVKPR